MRRIFIAIIFIAMTIVIIASIFVIPSKTTTVQWVAAVVLGIFGGFAAIAEIVGLFERIISVPTKRKKKLRELRFQKAINHVICKF